MLSLVQVPKCYCSGLDISPEVLRVDFSCLELFSVTVFISPPLDGVLLKLYLSTVLGVGQAPLPGGVRAEWLRDVKGLGSSSGRRRPKKRP